MERPLADRSYSPLEAPSGPDIYFQRWLCSLARHERTLKIQLKRHMIAAHHTESVHTALLKKKIAKQARTRRRIVMLSRKLRTDQGLHPLSSLHIMRVCSQPPSHVLSPRARTDLAQSTGMLLTLISGHILCLNNLLARFYVRQLCSENARSWSFMRTDNLGTPNKAPWFLNSTKEKTDSLCMSGSLCLWLFRCYVQFIFL